MMRKNSAAIILTACLIVIGAVVYAFNLNNSLFWDDDEWIKGNVFVHNFSYLKELFTQNVEAGFGLNSNYYRPLLLLSFAFNYLIGEIRPLGYHLVSNGFHVANGILVFLLLSPFIKFRASFIAALLFLIHPVQTEAVTYISGRGDPMSVFFMLSALWLFLRFQKTKKRLWFFGSLVSMILGVLSRETAALFPLFLMIFYMSFIPAQKFLYSLKGAFIKTLPFFAISGVYTVLRLTVLNFENTLNFYSQPNYYTENLLYRLYTFAAVLIEYFKIIFFPVGLHMERDFPVFTSLFQWPVWLGLLIIVLIVWLGIMLYKKERLRKLTTSEVVTTSDIKIWFFGWSWFFIALGPVSGIIPINAIIYEHWLYLPLIGFAALIGFYLDRLLLFLKAKKLIIYNLLLIAMIIYFSFLGIQSVRRNMLWGDSVKFYQDILKYSPASVRILTNLGNLYTSQGDLPRAVEFYQRAIDSPAANIFPQPHYNLGNLYRDTGRIDEAVAQYEKAIEIDPNFPFAYQNLAVVLINNKQDLVAGTRVLEKLLEVQPGNPRVYYNLALLYLATGENDLAIQKLESGLDIANGRDMEVEKLIAELLSRIKS